jgi:hypothetical protein
VTTTAAEGDPRQPTPWPDQRSLAAAQAAADGRSGQLVVPFEGTPAQAQAAIGLPQPGKPS